jgi:hypothetical protein
MLFQLNKKDIMKIEFQITSVPNEDQKQYFIAYLEGVLKIFLMEKLFFNSSDILIAELGVSLKKWIGKIKSEKLVDFHYETMDSDENPIFSFKYNGKGGFIVVSPWKEFETTEPINQNDLFREVEDFLKRLNFELNEKCNVKLDELVP